MALLKAAYHFTDVAFIHLDADIDYYYAELNMKKSGDIITEEEFVNELLTQSLRHEVYQETKNIRELLLARAMASSIVADPDVVEEINQTEETEDLYREEEILKEWFSNNETV